MGKIRVKTLGDETLEQEQKKGHKQKREEKKLAKAPGLKGGQRIAVVEPSEEELTQAEAPSKVGEKTTTAPPSETRYDKKKIKQTKTKARERSTQYQAARMQVDRNKKYPLIEALELLPKLKLSKMDETVEIHINAIETGISGNMTLPHGTGKKTRVGIADDTLIAKIEKGKIDFDILVAEPQMMPKLAKVAKILGPRGLMPNPKAGTVTDKPEEVVKKFEGGQIRFKTEAKTPVIHLTVGKLSFGDKKLSENIITAMTAVQTARMKKAVLKSTMSPGIKLDLSSLN